MIIRVLNVRGQLLGLLVMVLMSLSLNFSSAQVAEKSPGSGKVEEPVAVVGPDIFLDTGDPIHLLVPGDEDRVGLIIINPSEESLDGELNVRVESYDGRSLSHRAKVDVPAKGRQRISLPPRIISSQLNEGSIQLGIKWLDCELVTNDAVSLNRRMALAYMEPTGLVPEPKGQGEMRFAIGYGAGPDNSDPLAALASSRVGFNTVRTAIDWSRVQKRGGPFNFTAEQLAPVIVHEAVGMRTQLLHSGSAPWATKDGKRSSPPDLEAWKSWTRALAEQLRGRVTYWEIWNEPELEFFTGTVEEYISLVEATYREIKSVDPSALVMSGGFTAIEGHPKRKVGMVSRILSEQQDYFDVMAFHMHGPFDNFRERIDDELMPFWRKVGRSPKPLYFTETGMDTRLGEHHQARTLIQKIVFAWSRGAVGYTWFSLHDLWRTQNPTQAGQTYGLYTKRANIPIICLEDQTSALAEPPPVGTSLDQLNCYRRAAYPKAAYVAMNTLARHLGGATFDHQIQLPPGQYAFVFKHSDRQVIVMWNDNSSKAAPTRMIRTNARSADAVDIMGNVTPLSVSSELVRLDMSVTPNFIVLHGQDGAISMDGTLVSAAPISNLTPDHFRVKVELHNPFDQPVTVLYEWMTDPAFTVHHAPERLRIKPGETHTIDTNLQLTGSRVFAVGDVLINAIAYCYEDQKIEGRLDLPTRINALAAPQGDFDKRPGIVLDQPDQVLNRYEDDPAMLDTLWGGFGDLSAHLFVRQNEEGLLHIRVKVRDDVHHSPFASGDDRGDRLEVHMSSPGVGSPLTWIFADGRGIIFHPSSQNRAVVGSEFTFTRIDDTHASYDCFIRIEDFGLSKANLQLNVKVYDDDGRDAGVESILSVHQGDDPTNWPSLFFLSATSVQFDAQDP